MRPLHPIDPPDLLHPMDPLNPLHPESRKSKVESIKFASSASSGSSTPPTSPTSLMILNYRCNNMKLFLVATPIGNLSDISERALETLRGVGLILCEDTRVTSKILAAYGIKKPLESLHQHSDTKKIKKILGELEAGKSVALVTDAGTPAISDPGGILVQEALRRLGERIKIIPIPGPSAITAALSIAGFPADEFVFLGFPPHKKGRQKFFDRVASIKSTIVLYESTHRIEKTLGELAGRIKNRPVVVCRELTKIHETIYRGTAAQVTDKLKSGSMKGEFVIIIGPTTKARK